MVENSPANAGDTRDAVSIPGSGISPGGRHGNPLQYSCLEDPMDGGAWWATVHGVSKSRTRFSMCMQGFLGGALVKNLPANAGDTRDAVSILG